MTVKSGQPVFLVGDRLESPFLVVCEHASAHIPPRFNNLGASRQTLSSHAAYDIGALGVAREFSRFLDAPLIVSGISRLVIDCNRHPDDEQAMLDKSEIFQVPGNRNITAADKRDRIKNVYRPFHDLIESVADRMVNLAALLTIHTFTPVYHGKPRHVDVGLLFNQDRRLADRLNRLAHRISETRVDLNQPYITDDRNGHTVRRHALSRNIMHLILEIRNDWVRTPSEQRKWGRILAGLIVEACDDSIVFDHRQAPA